MKEMKKVIKYFLILVFLLILPCGIEYLIRYGIFGYSFPETIFTSEQWFAFWGSYLGSIITVIVLFVTIRYNQSETLKTIKNHEMEMQYNRLLKYLNEIHNYINLCEPSGEQMADNYIIYSLRLSEKRYYELMKECENSHDSICNEYICLVKNIFYEYLIEANKIPKSLSGIEMSEAAEIYIKTKKEIFSIKHKYVQQESLLYDKTINDIEESMVNDKRKIFGINDNKNSFHLLKRNK